jgi:hypothetical protein
MFGVPSGTSTSTSRYLSRKRAMKLKEGWEGLIVALWMLLIAWVLVTIIKFAF